MDWFTSFSSTDDCIISLSVQPDHCQAEAIHVQNCQQDKLNTVKHCCTARSFTKLPAYQDKLKTVKHCCSAQNFTKLPAYQDKLKTARQRAHLPSKPRWASTSALWQSVMGVVRFRLPPPVAATTPSDPATTFLSLPITAEHSRWQGLTSKTSRRI